MAVLAALCFGIAGVLVGIHALASYVASKGGKEIVIGEGEGQKKFEVEGAKRFATIAGVVAVVLGVIFLIVGGGDDGQA
jgi:hypothetical protein